MSWLSGEARLGIGRRAGAPKGARRLAQVLVAVLVVLWLSAAALAAQIHILHFNDTYTLEPVDGGKLGGMARLATLVQRLRAEDPEALLLFAGDVISPSTMSSVFKGQQMIEAFNELGVDVSTFGNHEWDFGDDVLGQRIRESQFTWVAANVVDENGRPFPGSYPFVVREMGGIGVGVLGLVTPETRVLSSPGAAWQFRDPVEVARETIPKMRAMGAQVIVALTHQSMSDDVRLLEAVPEIDLVVGGHEHDVMRQEVGGRLIVKAGSDNRYLGVVTLTVDGGKVTAAEDRMIAVDPSYPDEPAMASLVQRWLAQLSEQMDVVIGQTAVELDARNVTVRAREAPLGNLVADAIRDAVGAQLAITNGGGIRTNAVLPAGPIRRKDVVAWLPFGNVVVKLELTGAQIRSALENGVSQVEKLAGRFPQVSGLRFGFDPSRPAGQRVTWVEAGGKPLDETATYVVATNDYMANGGDGYEALKGGKVLVDAAAGPIMADVVARYIESRGTVSPSVEGRIVEEGK
ncbi:MAG: 5'-nucleotidase C-terminal domain-containing protein [Limnochordaceae bacterium]|nr:5'-nucleotidase C-terminal domain-containing protein [Limnochordaceae bacterium]